MLGEDWSGRSEAGGILRPICNCARAFACAGSGKLLLASERADDFAPGKFPA